MSPRTSAAVAARTRASIVASAAAIGSVEGLGSLSFGRVAEDVDVTKSGVIRHFGTKEELQTAAVQEAVEHFRVAVWETVAAERAGIVRLRASMEAWMRYLAAGPFPGGCFITAASSELDGRPGPVRELVAQASGRWSRVLARDADRAIADGDLPGESDGEQVAFELGGIVLALNQAMQLHHDPDALRRAQASVVRILGPSEPRARGGGPVSTRR